MLIYFVALTKKPPNLEGAFLAKDLKKSPSSSLSEKELALTSLVAKETSKAALLNLWRCYSGIARPSRGLRRN
ncbi:UNVERIFIED_CONTAM: hypothetical protein Sradi_5818200 [Sesamum radiatum]|uniref:Uncharacterized protein n=1 Tax=Sesamum radiatum TaxID=300843 RepID=A0AAW2KP64_SESRA